MNEVIVIVLSLTLSLSFCLVGSWRFYFHNFYCFFAGFFEKLTQCGFCQFAKQKSRRNRNAKQSTKQFPKLSSTNHSSVHNLGSTKTSTLTAQSFNIGLACDSVERRTAGSGSTQLSWQSCWHVRAWHLLGIIIQKKIL